MLERVPNSVELVRTVDVAMQGDSEEGRRLLAMTKLINVEDPILAVKDLCREVIQVVTYVSQREKLGYQITSIIDQYENMRPQLEHYCPVRRIFRVPIPFAPWHTFPGFPRVLQV